MGSDKYYEVHLWDSSIGQWVEIPTFTGLKFKYFINHGGDFELQAYTRNDNLRNLFKAGTLWKIDKKDHTNILSGILTDAQGDTKTMIPSTNNCIVWSLEGIDWFKVVSQYTLKTGTNGIDYDNTTTSAIISSVRASLVASGYILDDNGIDTGPSISAFVKNRKAVPIFLDMAAMGISSIPMYVLIDMHPATHRPRIQVRSALNAQFTTSDPFSPRDNARVIKISRDCVAINTKDAVDPVKNAVSVQYGGHGTGRQMDTTSQATDATSITANTRRESVVSAPFIKDSSSAATLRATVIAQWGGGDNHFFSRRSGMNVINGIGMAQVRMKRGELFDPNGISVGLGDRVGVET